MKKPQKRILILGVTASGKSSLAFELARKLNAEIISIDSMKVYRGMDIGTAKPPPEKRAQIPYHLIDIVEPWQSFSVDQFLEKAKTAVSEIESKGKTVIAAGGTALYIKALLFGLFEGPGTDKKIRKNLRKQAQESGLTALHKKLCEVDPPAADKIHPNDEKRIIRALEVYQLTGKPISSFQQQFDAKPDPGWQVFGLRRPKEQENMRINARVKKMIQLGLVKEVSNLLENPSGLSEQARVAIGYAEIIDHLKGNTDLQTAVEKIKINTRKFAKSQRTWFKQFTFTNWLEAEEKSVDQLICEIEEKWPD